MNKEFLKMQKLAGLINEEQFRKKITENEEFDTPAYEPINDLIDDIFQVTGIQGKLKRYSSVSWLPKMHETDEDSYIIFYKKGNQEIAIGLDWEGTDPESPDWDGEDDSIWQIIGNTDEVNDMFGEDLSWDEVVDAVSSWLEPVKDK